MYARLNQLINMLKEDLGISFGISLGVFLFVLFFEPFNIVVFNFNNKLLFVAGLGLIVFLLISLIRLVLPWMIQGQKHNGTETVLFSHLTGFSIVALCSVAFAFYLRFVGMVPITFYLMLKVVLVCLSIPVILRIYDRMNELRKQKEMMAREMKSAQKLIDQYEAHILNRSIEFVSESGNENLVLTVADIIYFKSADNYVEIIYKEHGRFNKKLIRNTLKKIEQQIRPYSNFIRCHRSFIVNTHFVEKLGRDYNSHWLSIKDNNEKIPVSRQYLLRIKEIL